MSKHNQLKEIHKSGKSYAIYKSINGFDLYTDFSKKIILSKKNVSSFLKKKKLVKNINQLIYLLVFLVMSY